MVELTCISCGATEVIKDTVEEKRSRTCQKCGQSLVQFRQPGRAPQPAAHA